MYKDYNFYLRIIAENIEYNPEKIKLAYNTIKKNGINDPDAAYAIFFIAREVFAEKLLGRTTEIAHEINEFHQEKSIIENAFRTRKWDIESISDNTVENNSDMIIFWSAIEVFLSDVIASCVIT